jgi:hypothetical protein
MANKNYQTVTLSNEDLKLMQNALNSLSFSRIGLGLDKDENIERLYHQLSIVLNYETCESNSESALMNS